MSWYKEQLKAFLAELDVEADYVIDWGGEQDPIKGRTKSWNVKRYDIFDLPDHGIETLPPTHITRSAQADLIFVLEVLEYLICPDLAFANVQAYLKRGGRAYITAPLVYPYHQEVELDSLRFTENGLRRLANNAHLDVKNVWYRKDRSGHLQALYAADKMHPAKGYDHHDATGFIMEVVK